MTVQAQKVTPNPRIVITGVRPSTLTDQPKKSAYSLDWYQISVAWPSGLNEWPSHPANELKVLKGAIPPHDALYFTGEMIDKTGNYSHGQKFSFGRIYWHTKRKQQKIGVVMTGDDLNAARAEGIVDDHLIIWALDRASNIPRLDFALDVFIDGAKPMDIYEAWKRGEVETAASELSPFLKGTKDRDGNLTESSTVYAGAASSNRRVRIYDKQKERGTSYAWTRIELVTRDERAIALAQTMRKHGIAAAGRSAIAEFLRCSTVSWWTEALTGEIVPLEPLKRKESNTEKWLLNQVLPVLDRVIEAQIARGQWTIYDAYQAVLDRQLSAKNGGAQ